MRKQQQIWENEHKKTAVLPSLAAAKPSSLVVDFINFLKKRGIAAPAKVVDIGSGKGRNTIYLAKEGFEVYGLDYIEYAINQTQALATQKNLIHLYLQELDTPWPFTDNFFDIAIDCFSSIDIETAEGRETYKKELFRTLKSKGFAMIAVVSANDEFERELMKENPGKEKNSVYWATNGKFQKNYDEDELREFYKEFTIIALEEIDKPAFKLGKNYTATNYWIILQKP